MTSTMVSPILTPLLLILLSRAGLCEMPGTPGPLTEVSATEGGRVLLPCNVTAPTKGDSPILVLFYNGATGTPIYSIDARTGPLGRGVHWSVLGTRAHFALASSPQGLVVNDVAATDEGLYRCRVDFRSSPTRNIRVELHVIVPPRRVSIQNSEGVEVSGVIGPYPVGRSLVLTCHVTGGSPRPKVTWWHERSLLDDVVEEAKGQVTRNILTLPNLTRQHLYRVLTCQADNSNMTRPLAATVTLNLTFPPLEVKILASDTALSEGERYSVVCEAGGSRPAATLTWWLDGVLKTDTKDQVLQEGNVSRSTLHLVPRRTNHGSMISCRADNPQLDGAALEDSRKLVVYYSPKLQLRPGQNLDMSNIKEGDDVYFECDIQANPSVFKVQWFLNGEELQHNVAAGVIQSNQSLVLQKVGRTSSGLYTCRAVNMQGSDSSNAVQLNVKYAPVCTAGQKWVYGGGRLQPVNVTCRVEAHPDATRFRWAFNTSSEFMEIPQERIQSSRGRSLVSYTPETLHDFGSLLCWGVNDLDEQRQPCVFHIVPASVPEAVHNCSVWQNASRAGEVVVACQAGWGGGLSQTFTLEVRQGPGPGAPQGSSNLGKVLASLRDQPTPHFTVTGLAPGTEYHLAVVATNSQGDATPTILVHLTPIDVAEKRMSAAAAGASGGPGKITLTPIVGVLVGLVASLLVCSAVVIVVVRSRHARAHHAHTKIVYDQATPITKAGEDEGGAAELQQLQQERGPDIILVKGDVKACPEEQQVPPRGYRNGQDGSFYINPGSLLNNGGLASKETDALLQDATVGSSGGTTSFPHTTTSVPLASSPSSFPPPVGSEDPLTSFSSKGRGSSSSVTSPVNFRNPPGLQTQPDLCPQEVDCDPSRAPLVSCSRKGSQESSV
ncbi:protein turtle-like isoform X2 [Panulirus ornatus]|uniref:protein turtle-like isoform X2 n=1 Tax=Panulirus ornatus TaxID=150431 RepID=UPI003A840069